LGVWAKKSDCDVDGGRRGRPEALGGGAGRDAAPDGSGVLFT